MWPALLALARAGQVGTDQIPPSGWLSEFLFIAALDLGLKRVSPGWLGSTQVISVTFPFDERFFQELRFHSILPLAMEAKARMNSGQEEGLWAFKYFL